MTAPHLTPPTGPAAVTVAALASQLPWITTDRLILRPCRLTDWPVLEPIWTSDRSVHIGGPFTPEDAWADFNQLVAGWVLRGHGALTVTDPDDRVLGMVLLGHEMGDPEPELGWLMTAEAEGQGYATEAARAMRDWGFDVLGTNGFVSYIAKDNTASERVADKLDARQTDGHPLDATVRVFRYGGDA